MDCAEDCDPDGKGWCDACLADVYGKDDPLDWAERQVARHFEDSRWMDSD
jgi:hypothetical protein